MFQFRGFTTSICLQHIRLPHSDIYGYNGRLHLPVAFRSLPRPSSSPGAKASPIRPYFAYCTNHKINYDRFFCFFSVASKKTLSTFYYFLSQYVNELFSFRNCGEYRSRTDDLLLAKQAL